VPNVACEIVRWVSDDPQPGIVEAHLVDADGTRWSFIDKWPIFTSALDPLSRFPVSGAIRCEVLDRELLDDGRQILTIDTATPDGVHANGQSMFRVDGGSLA
jgi:hypothetical protein